nr:U-box domain-containing protein 26 [Ipomoea batatas]GMD88524.1 U-box domain-containing protein 26 [Ipomoea batatas]
MKQSSSHHPTKLKTTPRPLFSCAFFRHCTQTVLSPTTTTPPPLPSSSSDPLPPLNPPLHHSNKPPPRSESESSSSSSNTSQSFTQWSTGSDADRVKTIHLLERSLVPNPADGAECPATVMREVVGCLKDRVSAKPASKVLLALCLAERNRRVAVEVGAVGMVVEALADLEGPVAERALAALELLCTVEEGAAEVRSHALAVLMMVEVMGRMEGRGKEYAISVLSVIYGSGSPDHGAAIAPPEEVARAVMLALQGNCSSRGRRKGTQLLKTCKNMMATTQHA